MYGSAGGSDDYGFGEQSYGQQQQQQQQYGYGGGYDGGSFEGYHTR